MTLLKASLIIFGIAVVLLVLFTVNILDITNIVKTYEIIQRAENDKSFPILSGYRGATFDGEFVYYSPYQFVNSDKRSNEFLRYDTGKDFSDELAWETISLHITDFEH